MRYTRDGRLVLSDSMMKIYQDCGARFWFNYLENPEPELQSRVPALEFGTVLHSMFYDFFKRKNPDAKMYESATSYANVFRGRWFNIDSQPKTDRGRRKPPMLWRSPDEKEKLLGAGYKVCYDFYQRNIEVPLSHVLVEAYFIVNITNEQNGRGYALQGYIDRLELKESKQPSSFRADDLGKAIQDSRQAFLLGEEGAGHLLVVDYKSGFKPIAAAALQLDTQFSCYDLAVELLYPAAPRRFAIEHIRDGSHIPTTRGEGERRVLRERIFKIGRSIEREQFQLASNMYKCQSCTFLKQCNSLQGLANRKGIHPEDLMRASSPLTRGHRKHRSLFEWKDGEIVGITDEKRLSRAEKLRHKPTQLSFFFGQEEQQELEEEENTPMSANIVESIANAEEWRLGEREGEPEEWDEVQAS
ncbi:MAG TPA: PD-(D/E)XK nuclease family protein [Chloroflexia bacterium]|nr:PD-(D/E)XK nuclease family protein [Chloroflexia bacterium]